MGKPRTILITGCSAGGIGDALAQEFHRKGLRVFATGRSRGKIAHLKKMGLETLLLDVTDAASIANAVSEVSAKTDGSLDFLLNNSGAGYSMPVLDIDMASAKQLFELNFFAVIAVTQAFMPLLIKSGRGTVVNNTSIASHVHLPYQAIYSATKAAATSLTSSMRLEFKPFGINVINIKTGVVKTNFFENVVKSDDFQLPENSYYFPAKKEVENIMSGEVLDPKDMTTVDEYAKKVVGDVLGSNPPSVLLRGKNATNLWVLATFFSPGILDYFVEKIMGMSVVTAKLKAKQS